MIFIGINADVFIVVHVIALTDALQSWFGALHVVVRSGEVVEFVEAVAHGEDGHGDDANHRHEVYDNVGNTAQTAVFPRGCAAFYNKKLSYHYEEINIIRMN